jgi:predicted dehydrogenase
MAESLKIGLVGAGYAAHVRADAVRKLASERIRISGAYDVKRGHTELFAKELGVTPHPSLESLCDSAEINAISIAVPNRHHYDIAKYGMERGKHVLCEYPLVVDRYGKGEELIRTARKKRLFLHVGQTMNYDADFALIQTKKRELGTLALGYRFWSYGALGSIFAADGFKGGYEGLWNWYVEDTRRGGWIVSGNYTAIQHFRKIFGEVTEVAAFDYRGGAVIEGAAAADDSPAAVAGFAAATVTLRHEGGASSSIQWGMPLLGKLFNTQIVCGGEGSIEIDGSRYSVQKGNDVETGTLEPVNTFVEDLKGILEELDGARSTEAEQDDMLVNLRIAMLAERAAAEKKVIKVR